MKVIFYLIICLGVNLSVTAQPRPFWDEIRAFKKQDSIHAPPMDAILFVGSSSFRLWTQLNDDFRGHVIINRGFGGSSLTDVIRYANDIIFPYHPKQVVIYCGENDLVALDSASGKTVSDRFETLFAMIRERLGKVPVVFVSIKPSPSRRKVQPQVVEANRLIKAFLAQNKRGTFIDIYHEMVDTQGEPLKELYLDDMLHMNRQGYAIWTKAITPALLP